MTKEEDRGRRRKKEESPERGTSSGREGVAVTSEKGEEGEDFYAKAKKEFDGDKDAREILFLLAAGGGMICMGLGFLAVPYFADRVSWIPLPSVEANWGMVGGGVATIAYSFYRLRRFENEHSEAMKELDDE